MPGLKGVDGLPGRDGLGGFPGLPGPPVSTLGCGGSFPFLSSSKSRTWSGDRDPGWKRSRWDVLDSRI